jgi:hypothetical protein
MNENIHLLDFLATRPWERFPAARIAYIAHRSSDGLKNLMASVVLETAVPDDKNLTVKVGSFVIHEGHYESRLVETALRGLAEQDPILALPDESVFMVRGSDFNSGWGSLTDDIDWRRTIQWPGRYLRWCGEKIEKIVPGQEFGEHRRSFQVLNPCHSLIGMA